MLKNIDWELLSIMLGIILMNISVITGAFNFMFALLPLTLYGLYIIIANGFQSDR
jgi:hypothetical protein